MKRKAAPKKKSVKATTPAFELVLNANGKMYSSSGQTMEETLDSLPRPSKFPIKGSLTISKNGKSQERVLTVVQMKRLYFPLAQKVLAKTLLVGL